MAKELVKFNSNQSCEKKEGKKLYVMVSPLVEMETLEATLKTIDSYQLEEKSKFGS